MIQELKVPQAGESVQEVQIGQWLKKEGDWTERDEHLVELETDKASMDLPAPVAGLIKKILKQDGETASVGETIALIDDQAQAPRPAEAPPGPLPPPRVIMPAAQRLLAEHGLQSTDVEATGPDGRLLKEDVLRYLEQLPQQEAEPEPPQPAPPEQPAAEQPPAQDTLAEETLAEQASPQPAPAEPPPQRQPQEQPAAPAPSGQAASAPVEQTTPRTAAAPASPAAPAPAAPAPAAPADEQAAGPPPDTSRQEEVVPMTLIRRRIAETLVRAQQEAALLTTFNEVDMSAVKRIREQYRQRFQEKYQVKLGFMSFFTKAVIEALKEFPALNARIREREIVYHNYFDIGVAIGGGKGLVVPALRNAERMSFAEIERKIADFAERAQANKIRPEELAGGTFTITNGGIYGSLLSTPLVNPPQSGVLGLHAIQDRPVALDGQVVIRPMMYLALTYDHRIVDGREAVTFLRRVKETIEDPARILLEV